MRNRTTKLEILFVGMAGALGVLALLWATGISSSQAQQGAMHNCPEAGKWAITVWDGDDRTDAQQAFATCEAVPVTVAYSIDSGTQEWSRWFAARPDPDVSNLRTLNNMQAVITLGAVGAPGITPTPAATFTSWHQIGLESIWHPLGEEDRLTRLHECSRETRTECVTAIMQDSGASRQAMEFFSTTGWFLGDFQEMGRVDLGTVIDPWRANENVQYAFLNGTPLVVHPEEEVQPVAIQLDPDYDLLVASFPDLFLWPGLGLLEALSTTEGGGQRFVIQFRLVDGCHACETGYRARVAFDFGVDGTYLGVGPLPLSLCWGGGPDVTPVSTSILACPLS
jgi:hypothetical protein